MAFLIEKNIPFDPRRRTKYPFSEMQVGDSFLIPLSSVREDPKASIKASSSANQFRRRNGWTFTVRTMLDGSVRVWRVA